MNKTAIMAARESAHRKWVKSKEEDTQRSKEVLEAYLAKKRLQKDSAEVNIASQFVELEINKAISFGGLRTYITTRQIRKAIEDFAPKPTFKPEDYVAILDIIKDMLQDLGYKTEYQPSSLSGAWTVDDYSYHQILLVRWD